jgi:hypothetical protein
MRFCCCRLQSGDEEASLNFWRPLKRVERLRKTAAEAGRKQLPNHQHLENSRSIDDAETPSLSWEEISNLINKYTSVSGLQLAFP